jgi:hypothetical protein
VEVCKPVSRAQLEGAEAELHHHRRRADDPEELGAAPMESSWGSQRSTEWSSMFVPWFEMAEAETGMGPGWRRWNRSRPVGGGGGGDGTGSQTGGAQAAAVADLVHTRMGAAADRSRLGELMLVGFRCKKWDVECGWTRCEEPGGALERRKGRRVGSETEYWYCLDDRGKYLPQGKWFAPPICPMGCLDGGVNVEVDERWKAGPTTNLLQFAQIYSNLLPFRGKGN